VRSEKDQVAQVFAPLVSVAAAKSRGVPETKSAASPIATSTRPALTPSAAVPSRRSLSLKLEPTMPEVLVSTPFPKEERVAEEGAASSLTKRYSDVVVVTGSTP
jgi:hypothetical protein